MKEPPEVMSLVKVIRISKGWKDLDLMDKIGLVRILIPSFANRTIVAVEFINWDKGHRLMFRLLDKPSGWFFYPEYLEKAE